MKFYLRAILIIFLPINLNMYCGCSKEPSHLDGSSEYPQHMFWMRNKENNFPIGTLIWRPDRIKFCSTAQKLASTNKAPTRISVGNI